MKYALGHAFSLSDLFEDFNTNSISVKSETCNEIIGYSNKRDLAKAIYSYHVKLVLDDLFKDDLDFKLPLTSRDSTLGMNMIDGDDFIKARKNGKFQDIDFILSDYTAYQPAFRYQFKKAEHMKNFYVDKDYKQIIADRTNEGTPYT